MIRAPSPTPGPTFLPAGAAPPTPPHASPLDDIYGSSPSSPTFLPQSDEVLSDLPSRQRNLDTDAYREGLSAAKGQFVQEGFDEGFVLGAEIGVLVGWIIGTLRGMDKDAWEEAKRELAIEKVLGREWVDEEGVFRWEVEAEGEEVTFREVARQHPVVRRWVGKVREVAGRLGVDLEAVEKGREEQS